MSTTASTAEAASQVAEGDGSVAALGPQRAAARYGLPDGVPDLADHPGNDHGDIRL